MNRKMAFEYIKISGYHGNSDWVRIYSENRISRARADEAYRVGQKAKINGQKCNCWECKEALSNKEQKWKHTSTPLKKGAQTA